MPRYSKRIIDHFSNPRNVGPLEDVDGIGFEKNDVCGDTMTLYLKIRDQVIVDARFQALGCSTSIAAGSVTTELIKGRPLLEARALDRKQVADALEGLPPSNLHSGLLAVDALKNALRDYDKKRGYLR